MPEFILDTSGAVELPAPSPNGEPAAYEFSDLDAFTQGYIEALFFTSGEPSLSRYDNGFRAVHPQEDDGSDDPADPDAAAEEYLSRVREGQIHEIPGDYGFADLAPEALARIIDDCIKFQAAHGRVIEAAREVPGYGPGEERGPVTTSKPGATSGTRATAMAVGFGMVIGPSPTRPS
jgi:hypothetical protein